MNNSIKNSLTTSTLLQMYNLNTIKMKGQSEKYLNIIMSMTTLNQVKLKKKLKL